MYTIAALYHFASWDEKNLSVIQDAISSLCIQEGIKGTILLASEGINGTVSGKEAGILKLIDNLRSYSGFENLTWKCSYSDAKPFHRMKVKLKKEIVTLGQGDIDVANQTATKVRGQEWNSLLDDPDCIVIDTRNTYETAIGKFKSAQDPKTLNFRDFPDYVEKKLSGDKNKKIAMYCTGGIRCEKASAYMKKQGFSQVYQLEGGILKYLEETGNDSGYWHGDCFVFDNRVAVKDSLEESAYQQCFGCRHPLTPEDLKKPNYREGVHCHLCIDSLTPDQRKRFGDRQKQIMLAKKRGIRHIGINQKEAK